VIVIIVIIVKIIGQEIVIGRESVIIRDVDYLEIVVAARDQEIVEIVEILHFSFFLDCSARMIDAKDVIKDHTVVMIVVIKL